MQIEQKLQTGVVAILLALVAIASPANSQSPEDCVPPVDGESFPNPSTACQAFIDSVDPTAGVPCVDETAECPADGAGDGLPCLDVDTPPGCDPDADPTTGVPCVDDAVPCPLEAFACTPPSPSPTIAEDLQAFVTCAVEFVSGLGPDVDAIVCEALGGDVESTADACLAAALDQAVCAAVGTAGTTFDECIGENVPSECPPESGGTFPQCTDGVTGAVNGVLHEAGLVNEPPVADAGEDAGVLETATLALDGTGSADPDGDALTYLWACDSGSLDDDTLATPEFTPEDVPNGEEATVLCSLTVNDGSEDSNADSVELTIESVNAVPTVSTADVEVNEASQVELVADAEDADGDDLTFSWVQTEGLSVALTGTDSSTLTFTAPNLDGIGETLAFEITVTDVFGATGSAVATVFVNNIGSNQTTGTVTVGAATASFILHDPEPTVAAGGEPTDVTYSSELRNNNGLELVDDQLVAFTVSGPQGLSVPEGIDSQADSGAPEQGECLTDQCLVVRQYVYDLTFPSRLADGDYSVNATYNGAGPAPATFTVANVAPTIDGALASHSGRASFPATTSVSTVSVDDVNWGSYNGAGVSELATLTFEVRDELDALVASGFTFETDLDGDATFTATPSLALSGLTNNAAVNIPVRVSYDDLVADGVYTVTAIVTDDNGATDEVDILSILLVPFNFGFTIEIDDGGDGIELNDGADVQPDGSVYDTSTDPLSIDITGTLGAAALELGIADFTSATTDDVITVEGMTVRIYSDGQMIGVDEPAFSGEVADNQLVVDLLAASLGASGTTLRIVLDLQVLPGADAAEYSSAIDVLSLADE